MSFYLSDKEINSLSEKQKRTCCGYNGKNKFCSNKEKTFFNMHRPSCKYEENDDKTGCDCYKKGWVRIFGNNED